MHDVIGLNVAVSVAGCVCVACWQLCFCCTLRKTYNTTTTLFAANKTAQVSPLRSRYVEMTRLMFLIGSTLTNYLSKWDDHRRRSPGLGWSMGYMKHYETMGGSKPTSAEKDRANVMVFLLGQVWARIQNCKAYLAYFSTSQPERCAYRSWRLTHVSNSHMGGILLTNLPKWAVLGQCLECPTAWILEILDAPRHRKTFQENHGWWFLFIARCRQLWWRSWASGDGRPEIF